MKPEGRRSLNDQEHLNSKAALPAWDGAGAGAGRVELKLWPCLSSALLQKAALQERSFAGISFHAAMTFMFSSK